MYRRKQWQLVLIEKFHTPVHSRVWLVCNKFNCRGLKSILIGRFGFCSGRDANKFQDVDFKIVKEIPVLTDTCGYAVCKVINKFETETHTVFLGEVIESKMFGNNRILMTYSYYQKVVKGV